MIKKSPNFLIIGAARSGTTTLYNCLKKHPLIYLPKNKRPEPHFFLKNKEFKKGYEYYIGKYFFNSSLNQIKGEASTSYLFQKYVPSRIYKYIPNCKFIIMLRNPVERAYSHWKLNLDKSHLLNLASLLLLLHHSRILISLGNNTSRRQFLHLHRYNSNIFFSVLLRTTNIVF